LRQFRLTLLPHRRLLLRSAWAIDRPLEAICHIQGFLLIVDLLRRFQLGDPARCSFLCCTTSGWPWRVPPTRGVGFSRPRSKRLDVEL